MLTMYCLIHMRDILRYPTGIKVNALAIGAWQWGDKSFWGYDTFGDYGDEQIRLAVQPMANVARTPGVGMAAWYTTQKLQAY